MYQLQPNTQLGPAVGIKRLVDNAFIPFDPTNMDYQVYTNWLAKGNVPEPYFEPTPTAEQIRVKRNQLLAASDWTQVIDAPVDQAAWAVYRQALRDITGQAGFPTTIDWPVEP